MSVHQITNGARLSEIPMHISDKPLCENSCCAVLQDICRQLENSRRRVYVQQNDEMLDTHVKKQVEAGRAIAKSSSTLVRKSSAKSSLSIKGGNPTLRSGKKHMKTVEVVLAAAERSGLLHGKEGRIGGRVSPELVKRAKARTGIKTDSDLIEFALANVALEDRFAESFRAARGTVGPDLDLGF
jgi:hypothetical protein